MKTVLVACGLGMLAVLAVSTSGCRDLVDPATVESLGKLRTVEGRLIGLDGLDALDGVFAVRVFDEVAGGTAVVDLGKVEGGPDFTLEIPVGTQARGDIAFDWRTPSGLVDYTFYDVLLDGSPLTLDYAPRRWSGRLDWPEGFPAQPGTDALVRLREVGVVGGDVVSTNEAFFSFDVVDGFDVLAPNTAWSVLLRTFDLDRIDQLWLIWSDLPWGEDQQLEVPLVPVRLQVNAPAAVHPDFAARFEFRSDPGEQPSTIVTQRVGGTDDERSTWLPKKLDRASLEQTLGSRASMVLDEPFTHHGGAIEPDDVVTIDFGNALLRLTVTDGTRGPVSGVFVSVRWGGVLRGAHTGPDGILDVLVPDVVPVPLLVRIGNENVPRIVELQGGYTEVTFDFEELLGE